jgi:hypothetical protein
VEAHVAQKHPLTNQDFLAMARVHFPDSTILKAIQVNDTDFDLSAEALVALKNGGVSQPVIEAMIGARQKRKALLPQKVARRQRTWIPSLICWEK